MSPPTQGHLCLPACLPAEDTERLLREAGEDNKAVALVVLVVLVLEVASGRLRCEN